MADAIKIDGLAAFARNLKRIDAELPKALRVALNGAANLVVDDARPRIPRKSGKAAKSLRAASLRDRVRIRAGGKRAPYYPWLDFGGTVGRGKRSAVKVGKGHRRTADQHARAGSVKRPFYVDGRYIYISLRDLTKSGKFQDTLTAALLDVVRSAGIEVD